jgi:DNA-binding response OmpR family regulator
MHTSRAFAHRALFVDDARESTDSSRSALAEQGFHVDSAQDPEDALELAPSVDVVVVDLALPEVDPMELCRRLRAATDAYIVAVGERVAALDLVLSLSVGADDFIPKPIEIAELVARVRALLRRPRQLATTPAVLRFADLEIDTGSREIHVAGEPVELSRLEFDLLETLARNPQLTLSRAQLLRLVWGPTWFGDDHVIDVHVSNLRHKLHDDARAPKYIRTVRLGRCLAERSRL